VIRAVMLALALALATAACELNTPPPTPVAAPVAAAPVYTPITDAERYQQLVRVRDAAIRENYRRRARAVARRRADIRRAYALSLILN
jgi:hypothetical protein